MPDTLNKQTLINLLIDSPLREPIKINLIDIVNNTADPDLPKIFPTITKELEIFQKATERRMKLADETIAKLGGSTTPPQDSVSSPQLDTPTPAPTPPAPPLDLPPLPTPPVPPTPTVQPSTPALSAPPLDLPPMPSIPPVPTPAEAPAPAPTALPPLQPLGTTPATAGISSDEDALAEIQKELESLKAGVAADANPQPAPAATQA